MNEMVAVTWTDAYFSWEEQEPVEDYPITTVGFVVQRGSRFLHLAAERMPSGWRAVTSIPLVLIENEYTLGRTP